MAGEGLHKMRRYIDLTGRRVGRFVVIEMAKERRGGKIYWTCRCDCGTVKNVLAGNLINGRARGCGCMQGNAPTPNTRWVTAFGETKTMSQWARDRGMKVSTLRSRIDQHGMSPERALMTKSDLDNLLANGIATHGASIVQGNPISTIAASQ